MKSSKVNLNFIFLVPLIATIFLTSPNDAHGNDSQKSLEHIPLISNLSELKSPATIAAIPVDASIVIAVDVSGSIDSKEYEIQKSGIVSAFLDTNLQRLLTQCNSQGVGVTLVEWSGSRKGPHVNQIIPWTHLKSPKDMVQFANTLNHLRRSSSGDTDIASALTVAADMIITSPFISDRTFISLSSDGQQDYTVVGSSTVEHLRRVRDSVSHKGIIINSIPIERSTPIFQHKTFPIPFDDSSVGKASLADYYRDNVSTGYGALVTPVNDVSEYAEAIKNQLQVIFNACVS